MRLTLPFISLLGVFSLGCSGAEEPVDGTSTGGSDDGGSGDEGTGDDGGTGDEGTGDDGGDDGSSDDGGDDGGDDDGGDDGSTADLYGDTPEEALPAPDFTATNYDGAARTREDLLGSPTVMWFYPAAATSG